MNKKNRKHLFDEWAEQYDVSVESQDNIFPFTGYWQVLDEIVRQADAQPKMQVLDLGIGTGNLARRFVDIGCVVWGMDFSIEMIKKAQKKLTRVKFVHADLSGKWPTSLNRSFDRIVSAYALHEFNLETKINLLKRLLSNNLSTTGRIIIGDIAFLTTKDREQTHKKWSNQWDEDEFYWTADEVIWYCKKAELQTKYIQVSNCAGVFIFKPMITNSSF